MNVIQWQLNTCSRQTNITTFNMTQVTRLFNVEGTMTYSSSGWCGGPRYVSGLFLYENKSSRQKMDYNFWFIWHTAIDLFFRVQPVWVNKWTEWCSWLVIKLRKWSKKRIDFICLMMILSVWMFVFGTFLKDFENRNIRSKRK